MVLFVSDVYCRSLLIVGCEKTPKFDAYMGKWVFFFSRKVPLLYIWHCCGMAAFQNTVSSSKRLGAWEQAQNVSIYIKALCYFFIVFPHNFAFKKLPFRGTHLNERPRDLNNSALFNVAVFWLANPLTAVISARRVSCILFVGKEYGCFRGNADVLVCAAVLCTLYLLEKGRVSF